MSGRAKRPLNKTAVKKANKEFYANHPELKGKPLSANDPKQAALLQEWMDLYVKHGGEIEASKGKFKKPIKSTIESCKCSGIGLSADKNAKEFVEEFKKLQKDWPKLKPSEREQRIEDIANKQLKKSGVPAVGVVPEKLPKGNGGHLDFNNWQLALNEDMLNSSSLSDVDAKEFANTVYHESRHAEQWYLMAQKRASDGQNATKIRDEMTIPGKVAKEAEKNPISKKSNQAKCAQKLHDSVYGKDRNARNKTLTDVMTHLKSLNKANENYAKVSNDPKSTEKQKEKALKEAQEARKKFDKVYKDYRSLPEEADAFDTGDKIDKHW